MGNRYRYRLLLLIGVWVSEPAAETNLEEGTGVGCYEKVGWIVGYDG